MTTCTRLPQTVQIHMSVPHSFVVAIFLLLFLTLSGGCSEPSEPNAAAEGESIAATAPGTDVFVAPLDTTGGSLQMGKPKPVTVQPGYDNQPAFLPDGSGLVWTAIRTGQADVYRRADDSTTQLTDTPESEFSPTPRPGDHMTLVRVEADGRQRLWRYRLNGTPIEPVLPDADSVGYHAWLDSTRVALFRLGSPPTLQVTNVATGTDTIVARRIGRSLQSMPGRAAVSFVQMAPDSTTTIHRLEGPSLTTKQLVPTPSDGTGDFHAWTPSGHLLMATNDSLMVWNRGADSWRGVASLDTMDVTRLAVSPAGDRLAMVAAE